MTLLVHPDAIGDPPYVELPSGVIAPARLYKKRATGIDLFAGAGGMSLGFIQAGFEVVAAVDNDAMCAVTYMTNLGEYPCRFHFATPEDEKRLEAFFEPRLKKRGVASMPVSGSGWISHYRRSVWAPDSARQLGSVPSDAGTWSDGVAGVGHFFFGDVRAFTGRQILDAVGLAVGEVDCVFGGPPCQGFSTSGKRNVMDPRNSLVFEFARLVLEIQPRTMVMENVPGMLSMVTPESIPVIDALCLILEEGDFGTAEALKASLTGKKGCRAAVRRSGMRTKAPARAKPPKRAKPTLFDEGT